MRIAKEQQLSEVLGLQRGNVNPFSLTNDSGNRVAKLILDANLETSEYLAFHPMDNTATLELKRSEFDRFLEAVNRKLQVLNLQDPQKDHETITEKKIDKT
jgi:hypothetical protein